MVVLFVIESISLSDISEFDNAELSESYSSYNVSWIKLFGFGLLFSLALFSLLEIFCFTFIFSALSSLVLLILVSILSVFNSLFYIFFKYIINNK